MFRFFQEKCSDLSNGTPCQELTILGPKITRDFANYLLFEDLAYDSKPEAVWAELGVKSNPNVSYRRTYIDPHEMLTRTAIIIYKDREHMLEAASELDGKSTLGGMIRATPILDRLKAMENMEKEVIQLSFELSRNCTEDIQGLVSVISNAENPVEMASRIFRNCGEIKKVKLYPCGDSKMSYVMMFFNFGSEAYACELAYNGVTKEGVELKVKAENPKITMLRMQSLIETLKTAKAKITDVEEKVKDLKVKQTVEDIDQQDLSVHVKSAADFHGDEQERNV